MPSATTTTATTPTPFAAATRTEQMTLRWYATSTMSEKNTASTCGIVWPGARAGGGGWGVLALLLWRKPVTTHFAWLVRYVADLAVDIVHRDFYVIGYLANSGGRSLYVNTQEVGTVNTRSNCNMRVWSSDTACQWIQAMVRPSWHVCGRFQRYVGSKAMVNGCWSGIVTQQPTRRVSKALA